MRKRDEIGVASVDIVRVAESSKGVLFQMSTFAPPISLVHPKDLQPAFPSC
jgi:hypothetical protein